jgi:hypothetical protein
LAILPLCLWLVSTLFPPLSFLFVGLAYQRKDIHWV